MEQLEIMVIDLYDKFPEVKTYFNFVLLVELIVCPWFPFDYILKAMPQSHNYLSESFFSEMKKGGLITTFFH